MIENVIIRGRLVETLITSDDIKRNELLLQLKNMQMALPTIDTKNGLGDYVREFEDGKTITGYSSDGRKKSFPQNEVN